MSEYATNCDSLAFIDWMRDRAIAARWPERLIHQLDTLRGVEELEAEVAELEDKLTKAEEARDDIYSELEDVVNSLAIDRESISHATEPMADELAAALDADAEIQRRLGFAKKALERHK